MKELKTNKLIFRKIYSRDNCFLIQEPWGRGYAKDFDGNDNPYTPGVIDYINNGVVEIWENEKAINYFMDSLLEKNKKDRTFFNESVEKYNKILDSLESYWKKDFLESTVELKEFLKLFEEGTKYFMIYYYSCLDERTPEDIKEKAIEIRTVDSYYDDSDKIIRNTINHLYPQILYDLGLSIIKKEIDNPPSVFELEKRYKNCLMIADNYFEIEALKEFLKKNKQYKFIFDKVDKNAKEIKGAVAFKGIAKGRVKILKKKSQIASFKKGEILVSPMTTPIFVPAMKKAGAIITDEGGITCHAAVVAREFRRPCIIGTRIATKVLKDGDMVEVDANEGIVNIIKRK